MKAPAPESVSIAAGTFSAIGASACCVLPLAAITLGLGGAWITQLRELDRYFWLFVGAAVGAFAFAFYRLYLRPVPCSTEDACSVGPSRRGARVAFWCTLVAAKALIVAPFVYAHFA